MSFTFSNTIPASGNNPSNDQPIMLSNNVANAGIWSVDHIGFNAANGGTHQFVNMVANPSYISPPASSGNGSVIYSAAGTAAPQAQLFYQNSNIFTQLSAIRAWAYVSSAFPVVIGQSINVTSVVRSTIGTYLVTLTSNAVASNAFAILVTPGSSTFSFAVNYSITGTGTFNIFTRTTANGALSDPTSFSFQVLQI